jgi:hypothetical protein
VPADVVAQAAGAQRLQPCARLVSARLGGGLLACGCAAAALAVHPFVVLAEFSRWRAGWWCLELYLLYLAVGPHAVVIPLQHARALPV